MRASSAGDERRDDACCGNRPSSLFPGPNRCQISPAMFCLAGSKNLCPLTLIFFFMVPFTKLLAVVLSTCRGVGGCGCPIYINVVLMGTASCQFMYPAPIYASAADPMTLLIIFELMWTAPFTFASTWVTNLGLSLKNK